MSSQRRYNIAELDSMRYSITNLIETSNADVHENGYHSEKPSAAEVEDQLRTHMMNGTSPEELWAAEEADYVRLDKEAFGENQGKGTA